MPNPPANQDVAIQIMRTHIRRRYYSLGCLLTYSFTGNPNLHHTKSSYHTHPHTLTNTHKRPARQVPTSVITSSLVLTLLSLSPPPHSLPALRPGARGRAGREKIGKKTVEQIS